MHVLGGQRHFLSAQPRLDLLRLLIELALQHHAVVDHGDDVVEQLALV